MGQDLSHFCKMACRLKVVGPWCGWSKINKYAS